MKEIYEQREEILRQIKRGVKNPPVDYTKILPFSVTLHGVNDPGCSMETTLYFQRDTEIDLSHYFPNLNLVIKLCEKDVEATAEDERPND